MWPILNVFIEFVTILLLFYIFGFFGHKACGILAHWTGIKPTPPALKGEVPTTGLSGKSHCCCSVAQSSPISGNLMDCTLQASLSFTISPSLLRLKYSELMMPSDHLILCHFLLLLPSIFPNIRVSSNESALHLRWPKYWSFSSSISPSYEYSGLISFGLTGLISLQSKGLSRVFSNSTVQKHQFFSAQFSLWSNSHIHTWLLEKP